MAELSSSADRAIARRIETGHAHSAMASLQGLDVAEVAGGWAIFHQPDSPVTQAIGIGMNGAVAAADLDRLEAFFRSRGSAAGMDLCTLADPTLLALIQERGYVLREISHVLARRVDLSEVFPEAPAGIAREPVAPGTFPAWSCMMMQGFAGQEDVPDEQIALLGSADPWPEAFFGVLDGSRRATAAMDVHAGLATLFGDATLVHARARGLQLALIRHRLARAAELGCDLASAAVVPGSTSHRNYERAGFKLMYARVMVSRAAGSKT